MRFWMKSTLFSVMWIWHITRTIKHASSSTRYTTKPFPPIWNVMLRLVSLTEIRTCGEIRISLWWDGSDKKTHAWLTISMLICACLWMEVDANKSFPSSDPLFLTKTLILMLTTTRTGIHRCSWAERALTCARWRSWACPCRRRSSSPRRRALSTSRREPEISQPRWTTSSLSRRLKKIRARSLGTPWTLFSCPSGRALRPPCPVRNPVHHP